MQFNKLTVLSPLDGRYADKTQAVADWFSEYALIKYRVLVEIKYFIALNELKLPGFAPLLPTDLDKINAIATAFSLSDAQRIKDIEKTTNHDVKAVEYFIKEKIKALGIDTNLEYVHFGLTSQDVNNTATPLMLKGMFEHFYEPEMLALFCLLEQKAYDWREIPMLARTHGQPATPTGLGKEFYVFTHRLRTQYDLLQNIEFRAKFGGATGNLNAHYVAFPGIDWTNFANKFISSIGLVRTQVTTQIEPYDHFAAFFDATRRINNILIDLSRDVWQYISIGYFAQKVVKNEVGSSAMPHKVNPIDFENAEGNLGLANAILQHLSNKLPISRLQRDLTDSTVLRNIGTPYGHIAVALASLEKGLGKITVNKQAILNDLNDNQAVLAEAIQTILRSVGVPNAYELLKDLTRKSEKITEDDIKSFIKEINVPKYVKDRLNSLTVTNYVGNALEQKI